MSDVARFDGHLRGKRLRAAVSISPPSGGMEGGGSGSCRSPEGNALRQWFREEG